MMMNNPEDPLFKNLLTDYAAPLPDDGFSEGILAAIDAKQNNIYHVKRRLLAGAVLIGGAIAATQVPAFIRLTSDIAVPSLPSLAELPSWAPFVVGVLIFMLWALLDNRGSEVI